MSGCDRCGGFAETFMIRFRNDGWGHSHTGWEQFRSKICVECLRELEGRFKFDPPKRKQQAKAREG